MKLLWIALVSTTLHAGADSISIEVSADRHAVVREHFSSGAGAEFVYLASACASVQKITEGGRGVETHGSGPWIAVSMAGADVRYEVAPVVPSPRSCPVPILMPRHPIQSVSVTVVDRGSGLRGVSVPQLPANAEGWSATLPAVPSRVELEWDRGGPPPASMAGPSGRFNWNFRGLVVILVTWTVAYLLWARRQES